MQLTKDGEIISDGLTAQLLWFTSGQAESCKSELIVYQELLEVFWELNALRVTQPTVSKDWRIKSS